MSLTLQQPPVKSPESAMLPGMAAPAPPGSLPPALIAALASIPDTSIGPVALQEPLTWSYDFDAATGIARASYPGEVTIAGNPVGGPVTGTGLIVLQTGPTIIGPTITGPTVTGTVAGGASYTAPTITGPTITGTVAGSPLMPVNGVANGGNATAGQVGEVLSVTGTAVGLTTGVYSNLVTLALTAGDWDIYPYVNFSPSISAAGYGTGISSTVGTLVPGVGAGINSASSIGQCTITAPANRLTVASAATVTLTGIASFSSGTCTGTGSLWARRAR